MPQAYDNLKSLIDVSTGRQEASLYLKNGNLVNVLSGEIYPAHIAVGQDKIAYVGESGKMVGPATTVIDAGGYYVCPALIEPHYHPGLICNPVSMAEEALRRGITTIVYDNLYFFARLGVQGFFKMIESMNNLPFNYLWLARVMHQSPDPGEEELFSRENLKELFSHPRIIKSAEITRWPLIVEGNSAVLEKIGLAKEFGLGLEGHTAGCSYDRLNAVAASGIESCHEAITAQEAAQRLRLGFWTMLRHSSLRSDLPELLRVITEMHLYTGRLLFTTDGSAPGFIDREGLLDGMLRRAVKGGVDPITALQMCTVNPATYLGMEKEIGSIAPGRQADIMLLPDLQNFTPHMVISGGKVIVEGGELTARQARPVWAEMGLHGDYPGPELLDKPSLFGVPAEKSMVFPVINFVSAAITKQQDRLLRASGGFLEREDDILYCTLVDRRGKWVTNGFASGVGQFEAIATTFTTSHDILVLGKNRTSMARAAAQVVAMSGGIVLVEEGECSLSWPLELGGMMSDISFPEAVERGRELEEKVAAHGYPYNDFLYTTLFMVCDFLPEIRITAAGIINIKTKETLIPARKINLNEAD